MLEELELKVMLPKNAGIDVDKVVKSQMWAATAAPNLEGSKLVGLSDAEPGSYPPVDHLLPKKKAHGHRCFWQRILAILTCLKFFLFLAGR